MLEKDVASKFNSIFENYGLLAPINNSVGGWPDRLIQLTNSRVVAVEIKSIQLLKTGELRLAEFRKEQAAWLAKWQRNNGLCFLFLGIIDFCEQFVGYGIVTVNDWIDWIKLPNALLTKDDLSFISNETNAILNWFKGYART